MRKIDRRTFLKTATTAAAAGFIAPFRLVKPLRATEPAVSALPGGDVSNLYDVLRSAASKSVIGRFALVEVMEKPTPHPYMVFLEPDKVEMHALHLKGDGVGKVRLFTTTDTYYSPGLAELSMPVFEHPEGSWPGFDVAMREQERDRIEYALMKAFNRLTARFVQASPAPTTANGSMDGPWMPVEWTTKGYENSNFKAAFNGPLFKLWVCGHLTPAKAETKGYAATKPMVFHVALQPSGWVPSWVRFGTETWENVIGV